ncbi:MAG: Fungalysin/Thermolysin Propeptide Motif, partial [Actinomycetota bacterium]|nr:Fungalysin/Thermolysin Propeptide Motif [Actinomycetota bacterium]
MVSGPGVGAVTAAQGGARLDGATHALHAVRAAASGPVTVARDAAGHVHFVGTTAGHPIGRPAGLGAHPAPEAAARAQLDRLGPAFGIRDQARQLRTERARALGRGQTVVRFRQTQNGVPVLGGELSAVVDSSGRLLSVNG